MVIQLEKLAANEQIDESFMFKKKMDLRGLSVPAPRLIHIYEHYSWLFIT